MKRKHVTVLMVLILGITLVLTACGGGGGDSAPRNSSSGPSTVTAQSNVPEGDPHCPYGGVQLDYGIDDNANGVLDSSEIDGTEYICNGTPGGNGWTALINTTALLVGDANCSNGGYQVDSGLDTDASGTLDPAEVTSTGYLCNGAGGSDGSSGQTALVNTTTLLVGDPHCPYGGYQIYSGLDDNGDGTLQAGEADSTDYVCNGAPGADGSPGTPGTPGSDGLNAIINTTTLSVGDSNCPYGGTQLDFGVDDNANNTLDVSEVDGSAYVCNGEDSSTPSNTAPVANAGADQTTSAGILITLDGSGSFDPDSEGALTYSWSFVLMPPRSTAVLNDTSAESPTFTPDLEGTYVLSLSVSDGQLFSAPDYVMITTKSWTGMEIIEYGTSFASFPQISLSTNGNKVMVWVERDASSLTYRVCAKKYDAVEGIWKSTVKAGTGATDASPVEMTVDSSGNAIAGWVSYEPEYFTYEVYALRYDSATNSWGVGTVLNVPTTYYALSPRFALDTSGNSAAIWSQFDGTYVRIYANRYNPGTGLWSGAEIIDDGTNDAESPQVAVDANGNAIAVWRQYDGTYNRVYANRYNPGTGLWNGAEIIDDGTNNAESPQVAIDANGNAIAVWRQYDGTYNGIYANRYNVGTGTWGMVQMIEVGSGNAGLPEIGFDAIGNAFAVWSQYDGAYNSIYVNRYDEGTDSWGSAQLIDAGVGDAWSPQVAVDAIGNAFAVWSQYDGAYNSIYVNRYDEGTDSWGSAQLIETDIYHTDYPEVAFDSSGNAMAVWVQNDGVSYKIYTNSYE